MLTEMEIKIKGLDALSRELGSVDAEKFISLLLKEPFDYTKWQRTLFQNLSVEGVSKAAMQVRNNE
ncbi:hypothetical protein KAR48_03280 [bacterium]|nr:hypothetical protein [bacterium]